MPDPSPGTPRPPRRPWIALGAFAVGLATLALMVATEPRLSIVWDEGFTLGREARIRSWFRAMADPSAFARTWAPPAPGSELVQNLGGPAPGRGEVDSRAKLLSRRSMAWFWPFAREEPHGHPPFYAIVGLLGDVLAPSWEPLPRARLGPILAFSLASGATFAAVARRFGPWAGALAAGAWVLQPNLFGHGHYATLDGLLASLWVGAVLAFGRAVEGGGRSPRWGWAVAFGVLCGWAADTKLTGWFLPLPFVAWSLLYRDRRGWLALAVGGVVGAAVLLAFNPCWWADPVSGVERFFRSNLTRGKTVPIQTLFLGRVYETPNQSLPWYNTLAWTVLVTPVGFFAMSLTGAWRSARRAFAEAGSDGSAHEARFAVLALLHWGFLLALRALPHAPGHDGVRLFLPAFGMLAIVAGVGAAATVDRFGRWGKIAIGAALVEGVASVALMMPVPLSYFSPIVGGLPGAANLGMEPTYFWDALSDDALRWLDRNTPEGRTVRFSNYPTSWLYLKQTGRLRAKLWQGESARPAWYVMQNRPGNFRGFDAELLQTGRPAYVDAKWGVPLILIYPYPD